MTRDSPRVSSLSNGNSDNLGTQERERGLHEYIPLWKWNRNDLNQCLLPSELKSRARDSDDIPERQELSPTRVNDTWGSGIVVDGHRVERPGVSPVSETNGVMIGSSSTVEYDTEDD